MTKTKYYDLQMDDSQDNYDVEVVNANLKKIDEQMKTRENATDALQEPEFTVADKRENIASKEKMPKIMGKIAKWFSDLKTVAFSGSYNDLSDKPIVDANISSTSTNPVQNKVIKAYVDKEVSENVDFSTSTSKLLNDSIEAPLVLSKAARNLLPYPYYVTSGSISRGVTMTYSSEGTVTFSGTVKRENGMAPAFALLENAHSLFEKYNIETMSCGITSTLGYDELYMYFQIFEKSSNKWIKNAGTIKRNEYDWTKYMAKVVFEFGLADGKDATATVTDARIITDKNYDFVPYSGYDIKTCGKNLLDLKNKGKDTVTSSGVTYTKRSDGSYNRSGTSTSTPANVWLFGGYKITPNGTNHLLTLKKGHTYFIYDCVLFSIVGGYEWTGNNPSATVSSHTVTPSQDTYITGIRDYGINKGNTYNDIVYPRIFEADHDLGWSPYTESTVHIDSTTEFPLLGLKSFDGETNIISPGNVEVTYAKSDSGAAIVDTLKKSVSDGKTKVANAITDKGVETATDATFDVMAENIGKIDTELHGATLAVSTSDNELFGKTVTLTRNGANVGTTVFASNGKCSFVVQNPGTYTITCGEAHKDATVTSDNVLNKTVISVNLFLLKIVTFADGTDEEIAKMIQAHYDDKINIADYWAVGDTRTVSLSAMAGTTMGESHRAQKVQFVIGDFEHDELATPINGHSKAAVTLLQKDCLMDVANESNPVNGGDNTENGYMNTSDTNVGGWKNCARRAWCNNIYFKALSTTWQSMVKTVNKESGKGGGAYVGTEVTADKVFLAAEIEIFGSTPGSFRGEGSQYQYYKNATANRYKMPKWDSSSLSNDYYERSPGSNNAFIFCTMSYTGSSGSSYAKVYRGIAPCLCI